MTSQPIEAYGGVAVPTDLLRQLADQFTEQGLPFHRDHDLTKPIRMRHVQAFVKERSDGIAELRFTADLHKDDTQWLESHPGVSATLMSPLARDQGRRSSIFPALQISADHAWFDDEALIESERALVSHGLSPDDVLVQRAYQFGMVPSAQIFATVVLPVFLSLGAAAIWDGIKLLFKRRRTPLGGDQSATTTLNITVVDGDRSLNAVVASSEEAVAERALQSLEVVVEQFLGGTNDAHHRPLTVWDDENWEWTPPS